MNWRVAKKVIRFKVMSNGRVSISRYRRGTIEVAKDVYARHVHKVGKRKMKVVKAMVEAYDAEQVNACGYCGLDLEVDVNAARKLFDDAGRGPARGMSFVDFRQQLRDSAARHGIEIVEVPKGSSK